MKRKTVLLVTDAAGLISLVILALSGIAMEFVPHGRGGPQFRGGLNQADQPSFWGLTKHSWSELHVLLATIFLILMLVHIILHWQWIKNCFTGCENNQ